MWYRALIDKLVQRPLKARETRGCRTSSSRYEMAAQELGEPMGQSSNEVVVDPTTVSKPGPDTEGIRAFRPQCFATEDRTCG